MNPDFRDVLRELCAANARFLVVGAFAVSYHAEPRTTGDIDIFVDPTPDNAKRVYRALEAFGAPLDDLRVEELAVPGIVFQMGLPPRRIDVLTRISGVSFEEAWRDHAATTYDGVAVSIIGRSALLKNKIAAGRPKDMEDVELLKKHQPR